MKGEDMKPGPDPQTAAMVPAVDEDTALAELTDFFDNCDVTGMEDVEGDDLKFAVKLWNMSGLDKDKRPYPKNAFFDTVDEETSDSVSCVFLLTQKTLRWDEYDNAEKKTIINCSSEDRKIGTMADGRTRPCDGCPDSRWYRDSDGNPKRKCGAVHTVVGIETGSQKPFLIRFKKTGLKPFRSYLGKHHVGKMKGKNGRPRDVPLFAYEVTLSLDMHESGNYALPVLERGRLLSPAEAKEMYENTKTFVEMKDKILRHVDVQSDKHGAVDSESTNINPDDFVDDSM